MLKADGALVFWHTFRAMVGKEDMASGVLPALSPWSDWAQIYSQLAFTLGILVGRSFFCWSCWAGLPGKDTDTLRKGTGKAGYP